MKSHPSLKGTLEEAQTHFTQIQLLGLKRAASYFGAPHWVVRDVSLPVLLLTIALFHRQASAGGDTHTSRCMLAGWAEVWMVHHLHGARDEAKALLTAADLSGDLPSSYILAGDDPPIAHMSPAAVAIFVAMLIRRRPEPKNWVAVAFTLRWWEGHRRVVVEKCAKALAGGAS